MKQQEVRIETANTALAGDLVMPDNAHGMVLFAHGTGSSRFSPRNRSVAEALQEAGFGTFLIDLLTVEEERAEAATGHLRFDIDLLVGRLFAALDWLRTQMLALPVGLFGASTGAAAALVAAAERPDDVRAVVSRGGRPDLAGEALTRVRAPVLLIVGGADAPVIGMNKDAMARMRTTVELEIVPGATHLFEEAGALDAVAEHAGTWFERYLV
jgi:putative phosphoribosyl transferase